MRRIGELCRDVISRLDRQTIAERTEALDAGKAADGTEGERRPLPQRQGEEEPGARKETGKNAGAEAPASEPAQAREENTQVPGKGATGWAIAVPNATHVAAIALPVVSELAHTARSPPSAQTGQGQQRKEQLCRGLDGTERSYGLARRFARRD